MTRASMACSALLLVQLADLPRAVSISAYSYKFYQLTGIPGRNWESFSPDPYLTGVLFAETIKGIQSTGQMAIAKHFLFNEYVPIPCESCFATIVTHILPADRNTSDRCQNLANSTLATSPTRALRTSTKQLFMNSTPGHSPMLCERESLVSCAVTSEATTRILARTAT